MGGWGRRLDASWMPGWLLVQEHPVLSQNLHIYQYVLCKTMNQLGSSSPTPQSAQWCTCKYCKCNKL